MTDKSVQDLHRLLLGQLEHPPIPAELQDDQFLEGIYEHAAAAQEASLGSALSAGLAPMVAPEDVAWQEVTDRPEMVQEIEDILPGPGATPGWLWTRIRGDLHTEQKRLRRKSSRSKLLRFAVAAVVLVSFGIVANNWDQEGTNEGPEIVFELDPSLAIRGKVSGG